jgi:short subunit dehydrogenase-like uncharacterized protein
MAGKKELGIVVYGATGYTGKLVAEYMHRQYGVNGEVSWAIAGRSQEKLEAVREELELPADLPMVVADASDPASLKSMVERAAVVLTTVGPYQLYGSDLVAASTASMISRSEPGSPRARLIASPTGACSTAARMPSTMSPT